jgi:hypothetical protein
VMASRAIEPKCWPSLAAASCRDGWRRTSCRYGPSRR